MSVRTIGRYEIIRELGRGGMATVYLGFDPKLEREVAIKVLPSQFANDPEFFDRFEQEAKTLATLQHNAIVALYDSGEDEGFPYFIMQLMEGGSLKEKISAGLPDLEDALAIITRIARALEKAHITGVIHRDVKPSNILFDADGAAYLSDFGIVKLTQVADGATRTGGAIGTPHYMSPEQLDGIDDIDARADVYALAVVLYEMLTGDPPYDHTSNPRIMVMHLNEPIPNILEKRPDLPLQIDSIIKKGMAKDRDERYGGASELVADLKAALLNWTPNASKPSNTQIAVPEVMAVEPSPSQLSASKVTQSAAPVTTPHINKGLTQPVHKTQKQDKAPFANNGLLYALAGAGGVALIVLIVIGISYLRNGSVIEEIHLTETIPAIQIAAIEPTEKPTEKPSATSTFEPTLKSTLAPVVIATSKPTITAQPVTIAPTSTKVESTATALPTDQLTNSPTPSITLSDALIVLNKQGDLFQFADLFENNQPKTSDSSVVFHKGGLTLAGTFTSSTIVFLPFEKAPDGYYETEIEFLSGDMSNSWAGIILRVSEDGSSYYLFEINGSGEVRGSRIDSSSRTRNYISVSKLFDSDGQRTDSSIGVKNTMGIKISDQTLEFYINDSNRGGFKFNDTDFASGGIGLLSQVDDTKEPAEVNFSYLVFQ
ncbi:MAG: serine/threonine protein kinase [Cellvibrionaceae bacterium]|jgi:serine/threonine protein kinase